MPIQNRHPSPKTIEAATAIEFLTRSTTKKLVDHPDIEKIPHRTISELDPDYSQGNYEQAVEAVTEFIRETNRSESAITNLVTGLSDATTAIFDAHEKSTTDTTPIHELTITTTAEIPAFPHQTSSLRDLAYPAHSLPDKQTDTIAISDLLIAVQRSIDLLLREAHPITQRIDWEHLRSFIGTQINTGSKQETYEVIELVDFGRRHHPIPIFLTQYETNTIPDILQPRDLDSVSESTVPDPLHYGNNFTHQIPFRLSTNINRQMNETVVGTE